MRRIRIEAGTGGYDVLLGGGILPAAGTLLREVVPLPAKALLVSDSNVHPLYGAAAERSLAAAGFQVARFVLPAGEASKSLAVYGRILETLAEASFIRSDCVASLGGGVVGDLAGFAAATYMRGVRFVQIPTSLLAAVDSSVGGKTGIDLAQGKNLAGAFWQPAAVLCDLETLRSLPDAQLAEGAAEMLKYGVLESEGLFAALEHGLPRDRLEPAVAACIEMKGRYVAADEHDLGRRRFLNLGHTLGHAVEKCSRYAVSHGRAVAIGMMRITECAVRRGIAAEETSARLRNALLANGLPVDTGIAPGRLLEAVAADKKRRGGSIALVVPERIGRCRLMELDEPGLRDFLRP